MGAHLTDPILWRQDARVDDEARKGEPHGWFGTGGGEITVLEVGGHRASDTFRISSSEELRHYVDLQNDLRSEAEDSCWQGMAATEARSMKLFFLMSRDAGGGRANHSAMARSLPEIVDVLHTSGPGSLTTSYDAHDSDDDDDDDDEPVSPSSSPSRVTALMAHSRNPRFPLSPIDEGRVARVRPEEEDSSNATSWTWDTRHIKSTTLTVAESTSTTYFCLDFPETLRKRISKAILSLQALSKSPLFMDTLIIDEIVHFYRDAIKSHRNQMLAMKNEDASSTEVAIRLEALAAHWRTILRDIHSLQTHIHHLQEVVAAAAAASHSSSSTAQRAPTPPPPPPPPPPRRGSVDYHRQHTRRQSSEVVGPQAAEIFKLQQSTCEFWARCVNLYLERTTERIRNSTYRLKKTIPLRRRGSLPQLNRRLSNFTIEVAVQFQRNGSSVSTLALSFLSTIFVNTDGLVLALTQWWWLCATLVIPLTLIIVHLWFETLANSTPAFLRRRKVAHQRQQQQQLDELVEEEMD